MPPSMGQSGKAMNAPAPSVYKPTWVANSFLVRGQNASVNDITPMKIQKLVYMLHGWNLAVTGQPVIGEQFEAWPHGPVNSTIYHQFKANKSRPIREYAKDIDPVTGNEVATYVGVNDAQFYNVFDRVWNKYSGLTGGQLSDLTHAEGTPWSFSRINGFQYIPNDLIRQHFVELSKQTA